MVPREILSKHSLVGRVSKTEIDLGRAGSGVSKLVVEWGGSHAGRKEGTKEDGFLKHLCLVALVEEPHSLSSNAAHQTRVPSK